MSKIDLKPQYLSEVKRLISKYLPGIKVIAYGSRVRGSAKEYSDLDLAFFTDQKGAFYDLKEAFEESDLPFIVDMFAWNDLPESFKANILENHYIIQNA